VGGKSTNPIFIAYTCWQLSTLSAKLTLPTDTEWRYCAIGDRIECRTCNQGVRRVHSNYVQLSHTYVPQSVIKQYNLVLA